MFMRRNALCIEIEKQLYHKKHQVYEANQKFGHQPGWIPGEVHERKSKEDLLIG